MLCKIRRRKIYTGDSINQKAVNLHMLEDVFGWVVILIGAVVMRFTDFAIIDPIMSIGVSLFIIVNAIKNLKEVLDVFLEKAPSGVSAEHIKEHLMEIDGVLDVHHIHLWSMDGHSVYATMHIVSDSPSQEIKKKVRQELFEYGVSHSTLEIEGKDEHCHEESCDNPFPSQET